MTLERMKGMESPTGTELSVAGALAVLKALRKHWPIVVACFVLGGAGALLYVKSVRKVYAAATLIEIDPKATQPLSDANGASGTLDLGTALFGDEAYYQTQFRIITSIPVMKAAVEALSLQSDYDFLDLNPAPPKPVLVQAAAAVLASRTTVDPIKNSRLAFIRVWDWDPKRAKAICDAVSRAYIDQNLQAAVSASSDAFVWLDDQLDHLKGELEHNENALYEFKEKNNLPSLSINEASNFLRQEMQDYDAALTHTRTRKAELSARLSELAQVTTENPDAIPESELLSNPFLTSLRIQYRSLSEQRSALLAQGKGDNHPAVKEATDRLKEAKAALLSEIDNIKTGISRDFGVIERQEQNELRLFNDARRNAVDLNMKEIEFHRLDRARDENEKLFGVLLSRMKETDLARMMRVNNLRVIEAATVPAEPSKPRVAIDLAIGLIAGFLVGFSLSWLREQLDSSIKTPEDLEKKLGLTFLGLLPEVQEADLAGRPSRRRRKRESVTDTGSNGPPELIVHHRPLSGASEAARTIRTNLMFMNPDRPFKKLLVSSAAPSEGKTTIACSIAIAFAQGGQRVCIVDCDLRRPRLHRIFNRAGEAGVTTVLVGEATIDEVAKPTVVPNLWSIPAGPLPPNPADLLHSERFRNFVRDLSERFDRVIVDSPPLVAVTDSAVISTLMDATVFVVRAFKTGKYLSAQGLRALRDVEAPIVGAVLNAVDVNHHEYNYYYFYYKRDGYYAGGGPKGGVPPSAPPLQGAEATTSPN
jgi:capsular exopolysaccharide synthesis family protein